MYGPVLQRCWATIGSFVTDATELMRFRRQFWTETVHGVRMSDPRLAPGSKRRPIRPRDAIILTTLNKSGRTPVDPNVVLSQISDFMTPEDCSDHEMFIYPEEHIITHPESTVEPPANAAAMFNRLPVLSAADYVHI